MTMTRNHILLGILVAMIWGGNFIAAKICTNYFPPLFLSALRFSLSAACILLFVRRVTTPKWEIFWVAQLWGTLYFGMFFTGLYLGITAASASIAMQMSIPFTTLVGMLFFHERVSAQKILGILIAIGGLYILKNAPSLSDNPAAFLVLMLASLVWAVSSISIKRLKEPNMLAMTGWMSLFAVPTLLLGSWASQWLPFLPDEVAALTAQSFHLPWDVVVSLLYMSLLSTVLVNTIWLFLVEHNPVSQVMSFMLLVPMFSVLTSILVLDESITAQIAGGGVLVIFGMLLILRDKKRLIVRV